MAYTNNTTESNNYEQLSMFERGWIAAYLEDDKSVYFIAKKLGRAYNTIKAEIRKGSTEQIINGHIKVKYIAELGQQVYKQHRSNCCPRYKRLSCCQFVDKVVELIQLKKWSVDAAVHACKQAYPELEPVSTKTIYNYIDQGLIPIKPHDLPLKLRRRSKKHKCRKNKRILGNSIENRPESVNTREEFGHWEIDTVIGQKSGKGEVILSLAERKTRQYLTRKIASKTSEAVKEGMAYYRDMFGTKFSEVFKSITSDNGQEFALLSEYESYGTSIYFTHPYTSCERGTNERHNGLLRRFIPKGTSIEKFSDVAIAAAEEWINTLPRKILGYATPDELFDNELDRIYATK